MRTRRIAAGLLLAGSLAACGSSSTTGAASSTVVGDAKVTTDGSGGAAIESGGMTATLGSSAKVPDGFPSEIAIPQGELTEGTAGTQGTQKLFNLTVYVADGDRAIAALAAGLQAKGFEATVTPGVDGNGKALIATGPGWTVIASSKANLKTGKPFVSMLVTSRS
jgi:hypothetical protein